MAPKRRAKKRARSRQQDRLSDMPDDVLQHILGFLPAHEVVRTSVLSPRLRDLWKSTRRLHITSPGTDWEKNHDYNLCNFVGPLLQRRAGMIVDEVKLDYNSLLREQTSTWVHHALLCQAKTLTVHIVPSCLEIPLGQRSLVSTHLRKLELTSVRLEGKILDFERCPALEVLEMTECDIQTKRIQSGSVKLLCIKSGSFKHYNSRTCISVPSLVQLELIDFEGTVPFLESMPLLETASVKPYLSIEDECHEGSARQCCSTCADCRGNDAHEGSCILLDGLSSAVNLELTAYPGMFVFVRDLNWCPIFRNLKSLFLNDWCVTRDMDALVCILEHSPVLENLTLQLRKSANKISKKKLSALPERLKTVKVKCREVDVRVRKLLKFLNQLDIEVFVETTD